MPRRPRYTRDPQFEAEIEAIAEAMTSEPGHEQQWPTWTFLWSLLPFRRSTEERRKIQLRQNKSE